MKVVFFPIGIDTKNGNQLAPILKDGRYLYIPVPGVCLTPIELILARGKIINTINIEWTKLLINRLNPYKSIQIEVFSEYPNKKFMGDFLENKIYKKFPILDYIPHYNPDLENLTYGEGSENKAKTLSRMKKVDYIIFYESFSHPLKNQFLGKFLVGVLRLIRSVTLDLEINVFWKITLQILKKRISSGFKFMIRRKINLSPLIKGLSIIFIF